LSHSVRRLDLLPRPAFLEQLRLFAQPLAAANLQIRSVKFFHIAQQIFGDI